MTAQMAKGAFPKKSGVPPPTIQSTVFFNKLPAQEPLIELITKKIKKYDRLRSVAVFNRDKSVSWQLLDNFDVRDRFMAVQVNSENELDEYIKGLLFYILPLDKPLWQIHYIENKGEGRSAMVWNMHHAVGDGKFFC